MQDRNFKKYRKISLNQSHQIQYSQLYSLTPVGIGTPKVESLTSYISRLAHAHCVYPGILMERIVQPAIGKKQSSAKIHKIYSFTSAINGTGVMATDVVNVIEKLTHQKNLLFLTLANFSRLFPSRNLLHKDKKWCPYCYEDWRQNFKSIYEPLIWKFKVVTVCNTHKVILQEFCPQCNKKNYHLSWKDRPGYCSQCHQWLGALKKYDQKLINLEEHHTINWDLWVENNIQELLEKNFVDKILWLNDTLSKSLNLYAQSEAGGNVAALARKLQMPKNTVWMWCKNKTQPSLENLLHICYRLETSVWDFLGQKDFIFSKKAKFFFSPPLPKVKVTRQIFDITKVEKHLQQVLNKETSSPSSMEQVARELKINRRIIYRHLPELCKAISAKYIQHRRNSHKQFIEESCCEVQEITKRLHSEGIYPTENKVENLLSRPGFFRYKKVKKAFAEAKQKLNL